MPNSMRTVFLVGENWPAEHGLERRRGVGEGGDGSGNSHLSKRTSIPVTFIWGSPPPLARVEEFQKAQASPEWVQIPRRIPTVTGSRAMNPNNNIFYKYL